MTKPWEEEWRAHLDYLYDANDLGVAQFAEKVDAYLPGDDGQKERLRSESRAKLAAQAPAMARLLMSYAVGPDCPECEKGIAENHFARCDLRKVLKAAGVLE